MYVNIRKYMQIYANICKYMQTYTEYMQIYANICKYIKIYANICKYMQIHSNICKHKYSWRPESKKTAGGQMLQIQPETIDYISVNQDWLGPKGNNTQI